MSAPVGLVVSSLRVRVRRLAAVLLTATLLPVTAAVALDDPGVEIDNDAVAAQPSAPWHLDHVDGDNDGAYSYGPLGQGVYIYVIDSGIAHDHPDFTGRVLAIPGSDFIDGDNTPRPCPPSEGGEGGEVAHGTHVASTAAGFGYGLAKEATIVPLRVFDCNGEPTDVDGDPVDFGAVFAAIASHNASLGYPPAVVNMSLRAQCGAVCNTDPLSPDYSSAAAQDETLIEDLVTSGIIVVVGAGNDGDTSLPLACQNTPAFLGQGRDGVITVGNMTRSGNRNTSSSYGDCVDIYAPGTGITAADDRDPTGAATIQGTSMAAPMVAGAVALALSENPRLTKEERPSAVWDLLSSSATAFTSDKTPDAGIQLRLPDRWRNRSATTATTGYAHLEFDEDVTGLEADDISFEGTATGCVAGISDGPASTYTVAISCATDGTVIPILAADSVVSVADASTAPASSQRLTHLTFDTSAPAVSASPSVASVSGGQVTYELELGEPVFGLAATDFSTSGSATGCTVTRIMGSGAYYKVVVSCSSNGTLTLTLSAGSVVDLAGNSGPSTGAMAAAFTITGVPVAAASDSSGGGSSGSSTATTVPAASAGAEAFTPSSTSVPPTSTPRNPTNPVTTSPPVGGEASPVKPAPVEVTKIADAPRGALRGSTISVGKRRISGSISASNGRSPVIIEVRNRNGKVVRTLTVDTRKASDFTIFLPAGTYRLTMRSTVKGSASWSLPAVRVPR